MKTAEDISRLYFKLSNQADLAAIEELLQTEATYHSAKMGLYYGRDDIMKMMQKFFASKQNIQWQINSLKNISEHIIEIHFTCHVINPDGKAHNFDGIENLVVVNGLIRHIEVK